ncbi:MAG: hypothetical protein ACI8ZF_000071 [Candidatus Midichloriaceae bacterium]|jgi:hypothetical protein
MLVELFCVIDDFCIIFLPQWNAKMLKNGQKKRIKVGKMTVSEIMTIIVAFHQSDYRTFKWFYLCHIKAHYSHYFPNLLSYPRFVAVMKSALLPLCAFVHSLSGEKTGIYFVDSTLLKACHIKREKQNKVFAGIAKKSKSTMGWFFGFKLHIVINDKGEIMAFKITKGNVDDRDPVPAMTQGLVGKLIGDKGYISNNLFLELLDDGLQLITKIKKGMKNKLMPLIDKILLRKRAVIESVNDQLKNISQIEHTRHRSVWNFACNIIAGLCAYSLQPKKPSIRRDANNMVHCA